MNWEELRQTRRVEPYPITTQMTTDRVAEQCHATIAVTSLPNCLH